MKAKLVIVASLIVSGCVPPPRQQLAPTQRSVGVSPAQVVQIASRELTAAGYDITTLDANAGTVVAARKAAPEALRTEVACNGAPGSMLQRLGETTHKISVTARPLGRDSASVQITGRAVTSHSKMPGMFSNSPDNETDCTSTGAIERQVVAALHP